MIPLAIKLHVLYYMNMYSCSCCANLSATATDIAELSATLKLVAEPNRLRILCLLADESEHCVCEFNDHMPTISQSLLSHHLADLRKAALIEGEKKGLRVYYRLTDEGKRVLQIVLSLKHKEGEKTPCVSK